MTAQLYERPVVYRSFMLRISDWRGHQVQLSEANHRGHEASFVPRGFGLREATVRIYPA
jgi:hypothetical protein